MPCSLNVSACLSLFLCWVALVRYIKKIYPYDDPRNLPNNPNLHIPRALMSEDGCSVTSSADLSKGVNTLDMSRGVHTLDLLEKGGAAGAARRGDPLDALSQRKLHSSSLFSYNSSSSPSTDNDSLDRRLLNYSDQQSLSHQTHRPTVSGDHHFFVEDTMDSPQMLSRRRHTLSDQVEDVSEL